MKGTNTKQEGGMRMVYFAEQGLVYGVCLDFDIVVHGADLTDVQHELLNVCLDHIRTVIKNNLDDTLLNRHAPKEYWDKYETAQKTSPQTSSHSVLSTYFQRYPSLSIA